MKKEIFTALLVGRNQNILLALPHLLSRAGFSIDVITSFYALKYSLFIDQFTFIPAAKPLVQAISKAIEKQYDWIIVTEEEILQEVMDSSLSLEIKLRILPVLGVEHFPHLNSKTALSQIFAAHGIKTPLFHIVHNAQEAFLVAARLGYPVLLKKDASSGGGGIVECLAPSDFKTISSGFFDRKVLVQKKIEGEVLDLSALFFEGQLIHFNYARQEKTTSGKFGPSSLRTYRALPFVEESFFCELSQIGKALGINGFSNITAIRQSDGNCFYIEADARPNAWLDFPRFLGEDISLRIRDWFSERKILRYPIQAYPRQSRQKVLPYYLRLKAWEILFNRYRVWRYIPMNDRKLVAFLLVRMMGRWLFRRAFKILKKSLFDKT